MSIRDKINENPRVAVIVTGVISVVAVVFILYWLLADKESPATLSKAYFTVDDGKSFFAAAASQIPPFQHEGKTAYSAAVFTCPHGKDFVGYMQRYSDADKKKIEELQSKPDPALLTPGTFTKEVKRPGDKEWVKTNSPKAAEILNPKCPEGSTEGLQRKPPPPQ